MLTVAANLPLILVVLTLLGVTASAALAARVHRSAENAWRLVPRGSVPVGAGYRASDIAQTHAHAPLAVRLALVTGLLSVGADTILVLLYMGYAAEATELGARQFAHYPVSAALNLASALQPLVVIAWMVVVAVALVRGSLGSKAWLARWRVIGVLGAIGNTSIAYLTSSSIWMVRDTLGMTARALGAPFDFPDPDPTGPWALLMVASALGLLASIAAIVGSRARRKLA